MQSCLSLQNPTYLALFSCFFLGKHKYSHCAKKKNCLLIRNTNLLILIIVQRDGTQNSLFIVQQVHCTCFGCQSHPSSGVHKTVTSASGTGRIFCASTSLQRGQAWVRWREVAAQNRVVSTTPIIRSTQNCNYSPGAGHIFCEATSLQRGQAWARWRELAAPNRRV